jgi:predicted glycoside hydrolase/deacetylase ChbG (UPF0249 family)
MPQFPAWRRYGAELAALPGCDFGLHFNLTEIPPESDDSCKRGIKSVNNWMISSISGGIDTRFVAEEFDKQINGFVEVTGRLPDYIDGHQHVHQFPGIREVIVDKIGDYYRDADKPYVRNTRAVVDSGVNPVKAWVISHFGTKKFNHLLMRNGIRCNKYFSGIYDFTNVGHYEKYFQLWLEKMPDSMLMMCHPGLYDPEENATDPIGKSRHIEYQFFSGSNYESLLDTYQVETVQFSRTENI